MRNSDDPQSKAAAIISRIQAATAEPPWPDAIDEAVDEAMGRIELTPPKTCRQLIAHVGTTIQDIAARLPGIPRDLNTQVARDEAAHLLAICLPGGDGRDLSAVMLIVKDETMAGTEMLYRRLGELLKERLRRVNVEWAFARHIDPADWETNRAVARLLLGRLQPAMPKGVGDLPPEAFVDCIPDLFSAVQAAESNHLSVLINRLLSHVQTHD